jgi:hypothetical protein
MSQKLINSKSLNNYYGGSSEESPPFAVDEESSPFAIDEDFQPFDVKGTNSSSESSSSEGSNESNVSDETSVSNNSSAKSDEKSSSNNSSTKSDETSSSNNSTANSNESGANSNVASGSNESGANSNVASGSNEAVANFNGESGSNESRRSKNLSRRSNESSGSNNLSRRSNESRRSNNSSGSNASENIGLNLNAPISANSGKKIQLNSKNSSNNKSKRILPRGRVFFNNSPVNNSTKPILEQMFNAVHYKAYILQKYDAYMKRRNRAHTSFDMYYLWNPLDVILTTSEFSIFKANSWLPIEDKDKIEILELKEVNEYGVLNHRNHSLIQQIKLQLNESRATIINIIKIAFYSGIYKGFVQGDGKKYYPEYPINSIYDIIKKSDVDRLSVKPRFNELLEKVTNFLNNYPDPPKILSKNTRSKK